MQKRTLKSKVYIVAILGNKYLVRALTKAGAERAVIEHVAGMVECDIASGDDLYLAGKHGTLILNDDIGEAGEPEPELPLVTPDDTDAHNLEAIERANDVRAEAQSASIDAENLAQAGELAETVLGEPEPQAMNADEARRAHRVARAEMSGS